MPMTGNRDWVRSTHGPADASTLPTPSMGVTIAKIQLLEKSGGRSGHYQRKA